MPPVEARERGAGYAGRESVSTRNPHTAAKPIANLSKHLKELARLPLEDRIVGQWKAALGCPLSDEAKSQFCIHAAGKTFNLADVRLWTAHHSRGKIEEKDTGKIHLEFFFDGSPSELEGKEDEFTKAFENMIESQLREVRVAEFRKKLTARRRGHRGGGGVEDGAEGEEGDSEWRSFLKKPIPASDFTIRSMREAGCMLRFLVCQTSLSISASELLGQFCFQEQFPIDGMMQECAVSTKPLPRWVYGMLACSGGFTMITILAWWQVVKASIAPGDI